MEEIGIDLKIQDPSIEQQINEKQTLFKSLPSGDEELYTNWKKLEAHLEFLNVQEEYIRDETHNLRHELIRAQEEVKRIQSVPLVIGQFLEAVDEKRGIVGSTTGSNHVVRILSTLDRELLKPSSSVALHRHSNALVDILPPEADSSIAMLGADEKPDIKYSDVGGLDSQKQEIREAVELPMEQMELYTKIGIDPPRGVLLYGPPGTGKTMLVKAVANATKASFIRVVGSEFVQKYLGEGPRMVRDVFRLARENSPCIIFIDEVDAIATKRFDAQTGSDREVQRILLELLNQMDGFDQQTSVKVIMATNRQDTLDPALLRPGRLDRKIEFPMPSRRERRLIFQTVTGPMNLGPDVDLEDYISRPDRLSSAEIASICQAAGLQAVRKNRYVILPVDFEEAWKSVVKRSDDTHEFYSFRITRHVYASNVMKPTTKPQSSTNTPHTLLDPPGLILNSVMPTRSTSEERVESTLWSLAGRFLLSDSRLSQSYTSQALNIDIIPFYDWDGKGIIPSSTLGMDRLPPRSCQGDQEPTRESEGKNE